MRNQSHQKKSSFITSIIGFILVLTISGCDQTSHTPKTETETESEKPMPSRQSILLPSDTRSDSYYKDLFAILAAEIAWDRNYPDVSVSYYSYAAKESQNPDIAKKATEFSLKADLVGPAVTNAVLWAKEAPNNLNAQALATTLLIKVGKAEQAYPFFKQFFTSSYEQVDNIIVLIASQLQTKTERQGFNNLAKQLVHDDPSNADKQFVLALSAEEIGDFSQAHQAVDKALKINPSLENAISLKTHMLITQNKTQDALTFLEKTLEKKPELVEVRALYSELLLETGDLNQAKVQLTKLLKYPRYYGNAQIELAIIDLNTLNIKKAEQRLTHVLEKDPRNTIAMFFMGEIKELLYQPKAALEWYNKIPEGPYYFNARVKVALLNSRMGNTHLALKQIQRLEEEYPENNKILSLSHAQILEQAHQLNKAFEVLNASLKDAPDDIDLLYARSIIAAKLHNIKTAEADLRRVLSLKPDHPDALNTLGFTLADQTKRYEEASHLLKKAMEVAPNDPSVLDSLGWLSYRKGNNKEAIQHFRQALAIHYNVSVAAHLGEVLWMSGHTKEAQHVLKEAYELDPQDGALREVLHRFDINY